MNALETRWTQGQAALNAWISMPQPFHAELAVAAGFDSVTIDLQHGLVDIRDVPNILAGIHPDAFPMVRLNWLEPGAMMKVMDAGALGVIVPMINTAEQAAEMASYGLYPPQGVRSNGPIRALVTQGMEYGNQANDMTYRFAMIETQEAVNNAEAILSTPGVDGFYMGPSDLARSYGHAPKLDHGPGELYDTIIHVLRIAKKLGKRAGIHCGSPAYAKKMASEGFDITTAWADGVALKNSSAQAVSDFHNTEAGETSVY